MKNQVMQQFYNAKRNKNINALHMLYEKNKNNNELAFEYAKYIIKSRDYKKAKKILYSLLKTEYKLKAKFEMCKISILTHDFEKARRDLNSLINKYNDKYAKLELAKLEIEEGNYEEARILLEELVYKQNDSYAILELGKLEYLYGNVFAAKNLFLYLINLEPNNILGKFELAKLEFNMGNFDVAKTILEELVEKYNDRYAKLELARLHFIKGNYKFSVKLLEDLAYKHNDHAAKLELGKISYYFNEIDIAISFFEELSDVNYSFVTKAKACEYLTIIYIKENKLNIAFKYFKKLLDMNALIDDELLVYICQKLNIFTERLADVKINYMTSQVIEYDEYNLFDYVINCDKGFLREEDVYNKYHDIKKHLTPEYKENLLQLNDVYNIPYYDIGENSDILRVITLPNSNNIVSMYPLINENSEEREQRKLKRKIKHFERLANSKNN